MAAPTFDDAPPSDDEMSAGLAGLASPPPAAAKAAVDAAVATAPVVRWLTDKKRVESFKLEHPFELDGVEHRVITIKRLNGAEVAAFMARLRDQPGSRNRFPLYYVGDALLSDAAWDTLDDDDRLVLSEIATDFLPERFRPPTEQAPS